MRALWEWANAKHDIMPPPKPTIGFGPLTGGLSVARPRFLKDLGEVGIILFVLV